MFTTAKTGTFGERAAWSLSRVSAKHPIGAFVVLLLVPPVGLLLAVSLAVTLATLPLALLFGWL